MAQPVEPKSPDDKATALLSRFAARRPPAEHANDPIEADIDRADANAPRSVPASAVGPQANAATVNPPPALETRAPDACDEEAPPPPTEPGASVRRIEANEVRPAPDNAPSWQAAPSSSSVPARMDRPAPESASGRKVPFWKRITLPRTPQAAAAPSIDRGPAPPNLEPILARLAALEKQLAANQVATESQLTRFEENITRLWELEDDLALNEVRERLALLEANQEEIADGLHAVGRKLVTLAVVLATGMAIGLAALSWLL
ncbi:MAG: hypothetical protein CBC48_20340 [bacterium TMED88]|nr:hypothetical protein [Deltaproteobacteria bacterium]OUV21510.1 MAG: hypothetical protein CBC48_20340 [bacterium TMED88]